MSIFFFRSTSTSDVKDRSRRALCVSFRTFVLVKQVALLCDRSRRAFCVSFRTFVLVKQVALLCDRSGDALCVSFRTFVLVVFVLFGLVDVYFFRSASTSDVKYRALAVSYASVFVLLYGLKLVCTGPLGTGA